MLTFKTLYSGILYRNPIDFGVHEEQLLIANLVVFLYKIAE